MAVTTTTRMGLTRWGAAGDPFTRAHMDASHAALETSAGGFLSGTYAARPAAAAAYDRFFYLVTGGGTNSGKLYFCDGAAWTDVASLVTVPTTATFEVEHTWTIGGALAVPSGDTDFINPMAVSEIAGVVKTLTRVRYKINSGTSATFKLQVNGSDATGFTALSATTTAATTDPADVSLADLDSVAPVITAVSGSPQNLFVTAMFKSVVTLG